MFGTSKTQPPAGCSGEWHPCEDTAFWAAVNRLSPNANSEPHARAASGVRLVVAGPRCLGTITVQHGGKTKIFDVDVHVEAR